MFALPPGEKLYCTGSRYKGSFDELGRMNGHGIYTFSDGTTYEGGFVKDKFNGRGVITLPSSFKLSGNFINGKCDRYEMKFKDDLPYEEDHWQYCQYPDRRTWTEINHGVAPIEPTSVPEEPEIVSMSNLLTDNRDFARPIGYQQDIIDENILAFDDLYESDTSSSCRCFSMGRSTGRSSNSSDLSKWSGGEPEFKLNLFCNDI